MADPVHNMALGLIPVRVSLPATEPLKFQIVCIRLSCTKLSPKKISASHYEAVKIFSTGKIACQAFFEINFPEGEKILKMAIALGR
jgi:hypothetical protein